MKLKCLLCTRKESSGVGDNKDREVKNKSQQFQELKNFLEEGLGMKMSKGNQSLFVFASVTSSIYSRTCLFSDCSVSVFFIVMFLYLRSVVKAILLIILVII